MLNEIVIGMAGVGTVGSGVYNVLKRNGDLIAKRCGYPIRIKSIVCRNIERAHQVVDEKIKLTQNWEEIANDPEINIVIEVMGGIEPAKSLIITSLRNGKDVITANKALLATHGNEIFKVAKECHRTVTFEAAVAGGIPIIRTLQESLAANRIEWIAGIVNGTTNYILTQMQEEGWTFRKALKHAQALGYAEADPTFDIEGLDAGHKISILSALAFGTKIHFDESHVTGINSFNTKDVRYAEWLDHKVKLLAIARHRPEGIEIRVHPTLVPIGSFLAKIDHVMNGIVVKADAVNIIRLAGPGAGSEPTASAVIADLIALVKNQSTLPLFEDTSTKWLKMDDVMNSYYCRVPLNGRSDIEISDFFAENGIVLKDYGMNDDDFFAITNEVNEGKMKEVWETLMKQMGQPRDAQLLHVFVD